MELKVWSIRAAAVSLDDTTGECTQVNVLGSCLAVLEHTKIGFGCKFELCSEKFMVQGLMILPHKFEENAQFVALHFAQLTSILKIKLNPEYRYDIFL